LYTKIHTTGSAHPFHTIVFARMMTAAKASAVFGPTSMPYTLPTTFTTEQTKWTSTANLGNISFCNNRKDITKFRCQQLCTTLPV